MDSSVIVALIGAAATIVAAFITRASLKHHSSAQAPPAEHVPRHAEGVGGLETKRPVAAPQTGSARGERAARPVANDTALETSSASVLGQIQVELIFVRNRDSGSGIVPPENYDQHMADRARYNVMSTWWYDTDPHTGEKRPAYTPISGGRLALIESRGIRHGERYVATYDVKDVTRKGVTRREMWLVDAQPLRSMAVRRQGRS